MSVGTAALQPMALHAKRGLTLVRGEGSTLIDSAGRRYLDLMSNYGVNVLGHAHPEVTAALTDQAATLTSAHQSFATPARHHFLAALAPLLPPELSRACFANSGSEAVEVAIKLARVATGRTHIVAMLRGYHGRTLGALSLTADRAHRDPFAPLVPDVVHVPFDDLEALEAVLDDTVAAVVVEPIQGEAGVRPAGDGYLAGVLRACHRTGSLLVVDEVQTGFRTGALLACTREDVVPDILCLGKGIANGLPLSVTLATEIVAERMPRGGHGSTFAGNPLVCAAGTATLRRLAEPRLHEHVRARGAAVVERIAALGSMLVREVRGRGLMIGIDLRRPATPLISRLQDRGVLVLPAGRTVIRLLPPLIISAKELDAGVDAICEVIAECGAIGEVVSEAM
jgi:acetylornithine/LysW-gamma-L-lysine aminotransferase